MELGLVVQNLEVDFQLPDQAFVERRKTGIVLTKTRTGYGDPTNFYSSVGF